MMCLEQPRRFSVAEFVDWAMQLRYVRHSDLNSDEARVIWRHNLQHVYSSYIQPFHPFQTPSRSFNNPIIAHKGISQLNQLGDDLAFGYSS